MPTRRPSPDPDTSLATPPLLAKLPAVLVALLLLTAAMFVPSRVIAQDEEDDPPSELEVERVERTEVKPEPVAGPPPLPPGKLPERTRKPPDPASQQYELKPVYVRVAEVIVDSTGETTVPDVQVVDRYLQEYLRRAGYPIAARPEDATYRIEGDLESRFIKTFRLQGRPVAYVVGASCALFVLSGEGKELERFEVPEVRQENVKSEISAFLQVRRIAAKLLWERLRRDGKIFARSAAWGLVDRLAQAAITGEAPVSADDIVDGLAGLGLAVVPVLLEALSDTRPVRVEAEYAGLDDTNRGELRVYHIADKALEEVFQKVSRMDLATPARWRFVIIRGWENEWSRFCPPWRESPVRRAREAKAKADAKAKAEAKAKDADG